MLNTGFETIVCFESFVHVQELLSSLRIGYDKNDKMIKKTLFNFYFNGPVEIIILKQRQLRKHVGLQLVPLASHVSSESETFSSGRTVINRQSNNE